MRDRNVYFGCMQMTSNLNAIQCLLNVKTLFKCYLKTCRTTYSSKIEDVVNEMRVLKDQQERSRRERQTTTKPSAHQARTGSLVRRNLKYDENRKNYCQSNVGDVLRIHVNKDIFRSSRLNTFLISSILFFILFVSYNDPTMLKLLNIAALAAIGQLHTSAV